MTTLIQSIEHIKPFSGRPATIATYRVTLTGDDLEGRAELLEHPWVNVTSRMKLTGEDPYREAKSVKHWLENDLVALIYELEDELDRLIASR